MDREAIKFTVLCIAVVLIVMAIYAYNQRQYETVSTMEVVPLNSDVTLGESTVTVSEGTTTPYVVTTPSSTATVAYTSDTTSATTPRESTATTVTTTIATTVTTTVTTTHTTTTTKPQTTAATERVVNFPIDLNAITHDELVCISGIGDATANKIIAYRDTIGGYTSRYQLMEINGIGEAKMNTIMQYTYILNEDLNYGQEPTDGQDAADGGDAVYYEASPDGEPAYQEPTVQFPIDLNAATLEDLCAIPDMDEVTAQRVLDFREEIGYYSNVRELVYIEGISEEYVSTIMEYVYVEGGQ